MTRKADGYGDFMRTAPTVVGLHAVTQSTGSIGVTNTYRVRLKAGGYDWVGVFVAGGLIYFDVRNGVVGVGFGATGTISAVADHPGYFDCFATALGTSTFTGVCVGVANGVISFAADGVSGTYVAESQLSWTSTLPAHQVVTDWTAEYKAALRAQRVTQRQWQDTARVTPITELEQTVACLDDWSGWGHHLFQNTPTARGLVSCRFNQILKSKQYSDAYWIRAAVSVSAAAVTGVTGELDAFTVTADGSGSQHLFYPNMSTGAPLVTRIYIKAGTVTMVQVGYLGIADYANFNISTGVTGNKGGQVTSHSITPVTGAAGWYLLEVVNPNPVLANLTPFIAVIGALTDGHAPFLVSSGTYHLNGHDQRFQNDDLLAIPRTPQRVNTTTDYDDVGYPAHLLLDGIDDYYETSHDVDLSSVMCAALVQSVTRGASATSAWGGIDVQGSSPGSFYTFDFVGGDLLSAAVFGKATAGFDRIACSSWMPGTTQIGTTLVDNRVDAGPPTTISMRYDKVAAATTITSVGAVQPQALTKAKVGFSYPTLPMKA
jgi:hypothetical protein